MSPTTIVVGALCILVLLWAQWGLQRRYARWVQTHRPAPTPGQDRGQGDLPPLSDQPDTPQPFGYKTAWLAVKCDEAERVMDALSFFNQRTPANWASGLAAAEAGAGTFVTPCLDGWVLAINFYESARGLIEGLAGAFPEAQYFCTHRVTEYHTWVKYVDGKTVRDYCYSGEQGEVLWDEGELTVEEIALGFDRFPRKDRDWTDDVHLPDEEDVLDVAAAWGVDPRFEQTDYPPSLGWVCQ